MTVEIGPLVIVMIKLFFAMTIGYVFQKKAIFNPQSNRKISELVVTVTAPCMIFTSAAEKSSVAKSEMLLLLTTGFLIYLFLVLFAWLCAKVFRIQTINRGSFMSLLIFANASFMGYPVVEALYGKSAILLASIVHIPFNLFIFTLGIALLSGEKELKLTVAERLKQAVNPGLIAAVGALILFLSGLHLPSFLLDPMRFVGDLTPALSMITLGSILAEFPVGDSFKDPKIWILSGLRLIIVPLIILAFCRPIFTSPEIIGVIFATNMMPCASMNAMLSAKYGGQEMYTAGNILVCTLASLVTIPLMILIFL